MRMRFFPFFMFLPFFVLSMMLFPKGSSAHGTGFRVMDGDGAVTMEFYYSSGERMSYADILVFSPEDQECEYQNGRADKKGRFAFHPDAPGDWRVEVNDGMGHKVNGKFSVKKEKVTDQVRAAGQKPPGTFPKGWGVVLGISIIFNLCGAAALLGKKKSCKE